MSDQSQAKFKLNKKPLNALLPVLVKKFMHD